MAGDTDLQKLLTSMSPVLIDGEFVFLSFKDALYGEYSELEPVATIVEAEGLTLVVSKSKADRYGHPYESAYKKITLEVYSSLDAVGLTAALATKLTKHGISANVIAGYFHDHIFVHSRDAERAINALNELSL